jgi:Arc/MetJ family transcription regulator
MGGRRGLGCLDAEGIRLYRNRMRTTLDLPEHLVEQAREAVGLKSKTDTVVFALREVVRRGRIEELKRLMDSIQFEFDPVSLRKKDRARDRRTRA